MNPAGIFSLTRITWLLGKFVERSSQAPIDNWGPGREAFYKEFHKIEDIINLL